jgi:predicted kinase
MDRLRAHLQPAAGNVKEARNVAYRAMHTFAEVLLGLGHAVILDATYGPADHRADVEALVARTGAALFLVQCRAPAQLATARFDGRATDHPADDLTAVKVEALARAYPYYPGGLLVNTTDDVVTACNGIERYIESEASLEPASGWSQAAIGRWP